jgi:peptidyl-prolyl cis-trans isomerase D
MNNEKNIQPTERKKEHTSVLEKIRRRTGLLVGIVGLALIIFILESLLGSGASIFGGSEMSKVGTINGKKIDRNEFVTRLENYLNNYRQRNQGKDVDDATRSQALESIWQQYIVELVMKPEFNKAGLTVGEDELYEMVVVNPVQSIVQNLTDPNSGKVNEQFARPDGSLDPVKWRQAVQNVTGDNEMAVRSMEEQAKSTRYFEKFRNLVKNGLYITTAEVKKQFDVTHKQIELSLVAKPYNSIEDSTIKITEAEIEQYYKAHQYEFQNPETTRKVEYVTFNVLPSKSDLAAVEKEAYRVAAELRGKTPSEDSVIMGQENENGAVLVQSYSKKTMVIRDSSVYKDAPGTVYGPYNEGAYYKIYKLEAVNSVADSARVRHILVGINDPKTQQQKRSMPQAKKEADSLLVLLKENKANFDSLVKNLSDDFGSKTNGGDYGWFDEDKGFVEPFKNAGLMGTKGNISVVETQFGYHIIEVLEVSKGRHNSYRVAQVMKLIAPSEETTQKVFAKANEFSGENNTAEKFDQAVEKEKLTKRLADNLREGDYQVPGLDGAREMVKWAYTANKGDVGLFTFSDKFVVGKLSGIRNKGVLPLEEVQDMVTGKVMQEKKAEKLLAEFNSKGATAKTLEDIAKSVGEELLKQPHLDYMGGAIDRVGRDNIVTGVAAASKVGVLVRPMAGESCVFALVVTSVKSDPAPKDYKMERSDAERMIAGRADGDVFNALKAVADIEFHKSRID